MGKKEIHKVSKKEIINDIIKDILGGGLWSVFGDEGNDFSYLPEWKSHLIMRFVIIFQIIWFGGGIALIYNGFIWTGGIILIPFAIGLIINGFIMIEEDRQEKGWTRTGVGIIIFIALIIFLISTGDYSGELARYGHHFRIRL